MTQQRLDFFAVTRQPQVAIVSLIELDRHPDANPWMQFRDDLMRFLETSDAASVIIDFANLTSFGFGAPVASSPMNSVFVTAYRHATQLGMDFRICRLAKPIRKVYKLSRIDALIPVHETLLEALSAHGTDPAES